MPYTVIIGNDAGFRYYVTERKIFSKVDVYGNVDAGLNQQANIQTAYRGFLTPLYKESGFLGVDISGDLLFCQTDVLGIPISFTGGLESGKRDDCNAAVSFRSGELISGRDDVSFLSASFSGQPTGATIDYSFMSYSFRGVLTPGGDYNEGAISFELSSITYDQSVFKFVTGFETGLNINFYLNGINYEPNRTQV